MPPRARGRMALLAARGLCVRYRAPGGPVYAVDGADFEIACGESLGIAGESACGKSTLGLAILRSLQGADTEGELLLGGRDVLAMPGPEFDSGHRWKRVSMVFQGAMNSLDPVFTVREQLLEVLSQHGFEGDAGEAAERAVASVGLDASVLGKYPHELSGGMRQRAVIAMALLLGPELVVADEPTTALDVLVQAQIISLLKSLKAAGTSFVLITHDLAVLSELADRVGIMYGGQLVEFGSAEEVYGSPRHPYTRGLLGSIPTLGGGAPGHIGGSPPDLREPPGPCRFLDRCPEASEKCREPPPKFPTGTGYVRCWLYE